MDDEDELFEFEVEEMPVARLRWADVPMLGFGAAGDLFHAASNICQNISRAFAAHANYQASRDEMRDQVHMDLESLPLTKEDGDER